MKIWKNISEAMRFFLVKIKNKKLKLPIEDANVWSGSAQAINVLSKKYFIYVHPVFRAELSLPDINLYLKNNLKRL